MTPRHSRLAIVDIDGTLVDSNYHHAVAWHRAFLRAGVAVPAWRIHRAVGMGGDRIVAALAGDEAERRVGDVVRAAQARMFRDMMDDVMPLPGARAAVELLSQTMRCVVLASSAPADEVERHVEALGIGDAVDGWTTAADVDATKPSPELLDVACRIGGGPPAVMIGDATWDVIAARRAGMPAHGVLTGGYSANELVAAGAEAVHAGVAGAAESIVGMPGGCDAGRASLTPPGAGRKTG